MGKRQIVKTGFILNDHQENQKDKCFFYGTQTARTLKHAAETSPHRHVYKPLQPLKLRL